MTPDFEQLAQEVADVAACGRPEEIAAALREVWNARGAADIHAVNETMKYYLYGPDATIVETLGHALRSLDHEHRG